MPGLLQQALYARQQWQGQANGSKASTGGCMICADSPKLLKMWRDALDLSPFAKAAVQQAIDEQRHSHYETNDSCPCWERAREKARAAA
jgi:hypothetical protein